MSHPALISLGVYSSQRLTVLLISNFRRVLNVVCFLLGYSPGSEIYIPTFRNTPFIFYLPMKTEQSVPKRQHINFRRRGITQEKAYILNVPSEQVNFSNLHIKPTCHVVSKHFQCPRIQQPQTGNCQNLRKRSLASNIGVSCRDVLLTPARVNTFNWRNQHSRNCLSVSL